jgi:hypothetical protein
MKTAKGSNYGVLLGITVVDKVMTLPLHDWLDINTDAAYLAEMQKDIAACIISGVKPSGTLTKQLERVEHHKQQMIDAYKLLFECYKGMKEPRSRNTAVDKARSEMLNMMDGKMLRVFAAQYLSADGADSYVLPEDREKLIADTVAAMKVKDAAVSNSV